MPETDVEEKPTSDLDYLTVSGVHGILVFM